MGRKCSNCGNIGHNSRTCPAHRRRININGGRNRMKLFGVQLDLSSSSSSSSSFFAMKRSFSVDCLTSSQISTSLSSHIFIDESSHNKAVSGAASGYLSDGLIERSPERKKGMPWTKEEHRTFLIGLEKLGKGDWRGISRNFVTTRTPTQVASHAQKYFLRQNSLSRKIKRRPSLFDLVEKEKCGVREGYKGISINNANEYCCSSRASSSQISIPYGSRESSQSQYFIPSNWSNDIDHIHSGPPNLDLTLAAPQTLDQTKTSSSSSPGCLLTAGTIAVI